MEITEDPAASDYLTWLNWGYWLVLAACIAALIVGGATMALSASSGNTEGRAWGLRMVIAGLVGAVAVSTLAALINYFSGLITS